MNIPSFSFSGQQPLIVGSFGDVESLKRATPDSLQEECDIAEIRLDLLHSEFLEEGSSIWQHLTSFPLLFTARCKTEGSPIDLNAGERQRILKEALSSASMIDIEVASIAEMSGLIEAMKASGVTWIASYHDFQKLPSRKQLESQLKIARSAGAAAFKCAAHLENFNELAELAEFQAATHGIPVASMGMGSLAAVSRLLCAQAGSVLNYGFLGTQETAPGQWSAKKLREGIRALPQL